MAGLGIRKEGRAGRITFTRPEALNALTHEMAAEIASAQRDWAEDDAVALILIDAEGDRAFCAGGDLAQIHEAGKRGDMFGPAGFWREEYRMNARMAEYPKPVVALMQGYVMGGGVGVGCHASHRVVGETTKVAMPECAIGLVPDVGGSFLLARAPGRIGEYLGVTGTRMGPGDAIFAGFADHFVPEAEWPDLKDRLIRTGDAHAVAEAASSAAESPLAGLRSDIDRDFGGERLGDIARALRATDSDFARNALERIGRNSPLSMACTVEMIHRIRGSATIRRALELEYRFTHRAMEHSDFLEGIRAQIIDKDRNPKWKHASPEAVSPADVSAMLMPLGDKALTFEEETP